MPAAGRERPGAQPVDHGKNHGTNPWEYIGTSTIN